MSIPLAWTLGTAGGYDDSGNGVTAPASGVRVHRRAHAVDRRSRPWRRATTNLRSIDSLHTDEDLRYVEPVLRSIEHGLAHDEVLPTDDGNEDVAERDVADAGLHGGCERGAPVRELRLRIS